MQNSEKCSLTAVFGTFKQAEVFQIANQKFPVC